MIIFDRESAGRIAQVVRRVERDGQGDTGFGSRTEPRFLPTYVMPFKAPSGGIPAMTGSTPGSASGCSLYDWDGTSLVVRSASSDAVTIRNTYSASVGSNSFGWCTSWAADLWVITEQCS